MEDNARQIKNDADVIANEYTISAMMPRKACKINFDSLDIFICYHDYIRPKEKTSQ